MAELAGKVALVTGGASGLGRATVLALAAAGARVVVADVAEEAGRAVAAEVEGEFVAVDVADCEANQAMVAFAVERCGGIDLVHLNAGVSSNTAPGDGFDLALYRRAMGVNLDGVVFGMHAALPALRARGGGSVVSTASLAGLTGVPMDPIYCANKHAVVGFTRAMAGLVGPEGIRVNAVCPGFAESAIIAGIREQLIESGFTIIPAGQVADAVLALFGGDANGECWVVQAGREPIPYAFRGIPGPRV
ncbi:MAG TPA: SDR family NAD(P)-dependent oxidoreductase [Solirubrobacteraceae bacterium]|nr:SDR family NAD(P)-dependent oxidoreductase [Solirubrobacteraceae bacterium]